MGDVNRDFTPPAFMVRAILVFLVILVVLACLLVGAAGWLQRTDGVPRVEGEIAALSVAIQNYFNDHGDYPRTDSTDELDPRIHGNPATGPAKVKYQRASLDLYSALSGDYEPDKQPDFKPERKVYYDFKPNNLSTVKDQEMRIKQVRFIQDPWGNSYGYSTARSKSSGKPRPPVAKLRERP